MGTISFNFVVQLDTIDSESATTPGTIVLFACTVSRQLHTVVDEKISLQSSRALSAFYSYGASIRETASRPVSIFSYSSELWHVMPAPRERTILW